MKDIVAESPVDGETGSPVVDFAFYAAMTLVAFAIMKFTVMAPVWGPKSSEAPLWALVAAFFACTFYVRMSELPPAPAALLRVMFASFAVYLAFPLTLPDTADFGLLTEIRLENRQFIFPILCLLGFWRPAFGITAMIGAVCERRTLGSWFGDSLSQTEFVAVVEVCVFVLLASAVLPLARKIPFLSRVDEPFSSSDHQSAMTKMTLLAICVHLSNYFYSGLAKALLGNNIFSWLLTNHTENMILAHNEFGELPISLISGVPEFAFSILQSAVLLFNAATFFGQLFAVIAPIRIRWIVLITLFYDAMHIGIFLASGIFFYKWIMLNVAIVSALRYLRSDDTDRMFKVMAMSMVLAAPLLFNVANLAWFDIKSMNHERIYAILDDGSEVEVPSNYWGTFSIHYAQQRRLTEFSSNMFPPRNGKIKDQHVAELANECRIELPPEVSSSPAVPDPGVIEHILSHHRYVLSHSDKFGRINYDFYPHHIWSMPWYYPEFEGLDKRRIKAYELVVEAVCLGVDNGDFTRKVVRFKSYVIPVPGKLDTL
jgi:hypothetical protein